MIIKVETYQGKAYLLAGDGRVWQFECGIFEEPQVKLLHTAVTDERRRLMEPMLAKFDTELWR